MSLGAMKQALEALNDCTYDEEGYCLNPDNVDAILALRAAIEQAQEPVAWMYVNTDGECEQIEYETPPDDPSITPLYTAPRQWQGLTEQEIKDCEKQAMVNGALPFEQRSFFARAIEAKLRERNT